MVLPLALLGVMVLAGCDLFVQKQALTVDPAKAYIDAQAVLLQAAEDEDPATRSHAIEALARTAGKDAGAVYLQGLDDEAPVVRYAAAMAIGDVQHAPALPKLQRMAQMNVGERDKRVFCAVIYALYRLGNDEHAGALGPLLFDEEKEVRMSAAMAMGKMGVPSAVGPLQSALATEREDRAKLQFTESIALLGDARSAGVLEGYTKGYFLDLRLAAIPALGQFGGARATRALSDLCDERHPARVRVSAAGQLARLGTVSDAGYRLCIDAIEDADGVLAEAAERSPRAADKDASSLKRLAAISLGWMGREPAANVLHPLLRSADGGQRVGAALSLVRLLKAHRPLQPQPEMGEQPVPPAPRPAPPKKELPKLRSAGGKD